MTNVYVCKVHDKILNESEIEIVVERNRKMYHGPLFWKHEEEKACGKRITRYLETIKIEAEDIVEEDMAVFNTYINLCNKYGIKVHESTIGTLKHWSFINGFTEVYHNAN